MASPILLDSDWVRSSFLVPAKNLSSIDARNRFFTSASLKYNDTSPGGSVMMNPPPQFTRTADLKPVSIMAGKGGKEVERGQYGSGLGRYYSEAIDDNAHLVHFRMGKAAYNSASRFYTSYYSFKAAYLARTGRAPGIFYSLGKVAGFIASIVNWKVYATIAVGRMLSFISQATDFAKGIPRTKFAYLKPTMPVYWANVQTMVNHIAANMGLVTAGSNENLEYGSIAQNVQGDPDYGFLFNTNTRAQMRSKFPDIFDDSGNLNIYAMATRGQRMAMHHKRVLNGQLEREGVSLGDAVIAFYRTVVPTARAKYTYNQMLKLWHDAGSWGYYKDPGNKNGAETPDQMTDLDTGFFEYFKATLEDGAEFVTFRVEEGGSISESFSNSASDSEVKGAMDGIAAGIRTKFDTLSGGNLGDGLLATGVQAVASKALQFAAGALDVIGLGGLAGLGGQSFADIPQHWDSSSGSLPKASYTIKLNTPYQNGLSKFIHETVPMCMLLCMALPHSTGPQSYASPFMLEFYDRGRTQCRYGMIDSISITRGTASTPFTQERMYNGVEVSISILDLTSMVHMPISEGYANSTAGNTISLTVGALAGGDQQTAEATQSVWGLINTARETLETIFTDDTNYTDYMAILSAVGLADNIYAGRKLRLRLAHATKNWKTHYSVPAAAMVMGDSAPFALAKSFMRGSEKAF